jgi:hypothetical protein
MVPPSTPVSKKAIALRKRHQKGEKYPTAQNKCQKSIRITLIKVILQKKTKKKKKMRSLMK